MSDDAAAILAALRSGGRRITTARRLIAEILAGAGQHLSAADIALSVRDAHPEIHLSTIYRTLESLCAWGFVDQVHQPVGPSFFQLAGTHHHLVCQQCGRIYDVPAAAFDDWIARLRDTYGFELHLGQTALAGRCCDH
jgi:Fur family transcriptional regulator, ferric uptake regulator